MFSKQIKMLRKEKKLSQQTLANDLKLTQQAIGKWETGKSVPDGHTLSIIANYFNTSVDFLLGNTSLNSSNIASNNSSQVLVPIIGTVKAGYNSFAFNEDLGAEYANVPSSDDYFYLIVKGDSMEPRIFDGDLALVKKQSALNDGELGVVIYGDDEATLKKFVHKGNTVILNAFNPAYESKVFVDEEINNLNIVGKVIETKTRW